MPNRAQQIYMPEFRFGLGGVSLGNEFNKHTDKEAEAPREAATSDEPCHSTRREFAGG